MKENYLKYLANKKMINIFVSKQYYNNNYYNDKY